MSNEISGNLENNATLSIEQASEIFGVLFENENNIPVVLELFKWLPWLAREQKIQATISVAKWWLENLKNTIV